MLVNGPVRILTDDGAETESDRFVVAVCRCRRSALYPLCDTSHRRPARG
ncbi:CDGSH iron-sulfur domain-containing protein [Rhodococcus coprophilus]|nr:CDGSH iron-sulfur domain-containing protein [Rhodococcus coprophilus]